MPPEERNDLILERLKEITHYAYHASPFYRGKWDEAGFHPEHLKSLEDFEEKVPVITKGDLRQAQARTPCFGDYLCIPEDEIFHIHGTSGTTGQPTVFAIGRHDWDAIANAHARIMWGMGLRPGDTMFIASVFSLYMGSWGALIGSERLGANPFPSGPVRRECQRGPSTGSIRSNRPLFMAHLPMRCIWRRWRGKRDSIRVTSI